MKDLKPGDRIRLKVRTISGWKGKATVVSYENNLVEFLKDGETVNEYGSTYNYVCRHEVEK